MKTMRFILALLAFLFIQNLNAQLNIVGNQTIYEECCELYSITFRDTNRTPAFWTLEDINGNVLDSFTTYEAHVVRICADQYPNFTPPLVLTVEVPDLNLSGELVIEVIPYSPLQVFEDYPCAIQDSFQFPRICEGTIGTYSVETGNPDEIEWTVTGGEIIKDEGWSITVKWDQPGIHRIHVIDHSRSNPTGSCPRDGFVEVQVIARPVAELNSSPAYDVNRRVTLCKGQTLYLDNVSQNATEAFWTFDNGLSSDENSTSVTYNEPGDYQIWLIADSGCECIDSNYLDVTVLDAVSPTLTCVGTTCPDETHTYYVENQCPQTLWTVSANGVILDGGQADDDFITVTWTSGPYGVITVLGQNCPAGYCPEPTVVRIPVISSDGPISGDQEVCVGQIATYEVPFFQGTEYNWTISSGGTLLPNNNPNVITVHWNRVQAPDPNQWVEVNYDNCYLECGGTDRIPINVLGRFAISGDDRYCEDDVPFFEAKNSSGAQVKCTWSILNVTGNTLQQSVGDQFQFQASNTLAPGLYYVKAQITSPDYCEEEIIEKFVVEANPAPPIGILTENEVCKGAPHQFDIQSPDPNFIVHWSLTDGLQTYSFSNETTLIHRFETDGPYTISATYQDPTGLGCESDAVEVNLQPYAFAIQGAQQVCPEAVQQYTCASSKSSGFEWIIQPANAGVISAGQGENEVEVYWVIPGQHTLILEHCGNQEAIIVEVASKSTLTLNHPNEICEGDQAAVSIVENLQNIAWMNEQQQVVATGNNVQLPAGHYHVTALSPEGCPVENTFRIREKPAPDAVISFGEVRAFCDTEPFTPRILYANTDGTYSYQWYLNGSPTGSNSPTLKASFFGTYHCMVTNALGCTKRSNDLVLMEECEDEGKVCNGKCNRKTCPNDFVSFRILDAGPYCNQKIFENTTPGTILSHQWLIEDLRNNDWIVNTDMRPTHTFLSAGYHMVTFDAQVQPTAVPGLTCQDNVIEVVKIPLAAWFTADNECVGTPVQFDDLTTYIPGETIQSYSWDFGDPLSGPNNYSNQTEPSHTYVSPGNYTVNLVVESANGCISMYEQPIEIYDEPVSSFTLPAQICVGAPLSVKADPNLINIEWNFGDAMAQNNVVNSHDAFYAYDQPGQYSITLMAEDLYGCASVETQTIQVINIQNQESITALGNLPLCATESITLQGPSNAVSWQWSNGMTGQQIQVSIPGEYTVKVTTADGCRYETTPIDVQVNPLPRAVAIAHLMDRSNQRLRSSATRLDVCERDQVSLEALGLPSNQYSWSHNQNGQQAYHPNWSTDGTYTYSVEVRNPVTGCTSTSNAVQVVVHKNPDQPTIAADRSGLLCEGDAVTFSVTNYDPQWHYVWSNGMTGENITVSSSGWYYVEAINAVGCSTRSSGISVYEAPNADVVMTGCLTRCDPDTICLPRIPGAATYQWYFNGNKVPSPEGQTKDFVAMESGTYRLEVTSPAGCSDMSGALTLDITPGYGDISVTVYLDVNENGVFDAGDLELKDIDVVLEDDQGQTQGKVTDIDGITWFFNQSAGDYSATVINDSLEVIPGNHDTTIVGCDGEYPLVILLKKKCPETLLALDTVICSLDTLFWGDTALVQEGFHTWSASNTDGCRDVFEVNVVHESPQHEIVVQVFNDINGNSLVDGDDELYSGLDIVVNENNSEIWRGKANSNGEIRFTGSLEAEYLIYIDSSALAPDVVILDGSTEINTTGCQSAQTVELLIRLIDTQVFVPNVFTPNGDNTNDVFRVFTGNDMDLITYFAIFDRWGELIFESTETQSPEAVSWDGTLNGQQLNTSVFVYVVHVETFHGVSERLAGDVTLLR